MITSELNQRISFYAMQNISDGAGGSYANPVLYWENTYAKVEKFKLRINFQKSTQQGDSYIEDALRFTVRYRADKEVLVNHIIKYRRKQYIVQSVAADDTFKTDLIIIATSNGKDFNDETT